MRAASDVEDTVPNPLADVQRPNGTLGSLYAGSAHSIAVITLSLILTIVFSDEATRIRTSRCELHLPGPLA